MTEQDQIKVLDILIDKIQKLYCVKNENKDNPNNDYSIYYTKDMRIDIDKTIHRSNKRYNPIDPLDNTIVVIALYITCFFDTERLLPMRYPSIQKQIVISTDEKDKIISSKLKDLFELVIDRAETTQTGLQAMFEAEVFDKLKVIGE